MDLERQYLPSLSVANSKDIFALWIARANATQEKLKYVPDIPYGPHPREVMDFYPADKAKGCVIFIHGGYWSSFSKFETSWVADNFLTQGFSVALLNYPLCPDVKIADICGSCTKAFVQLHTKVLNVAERQAIVVTGHSAGGYLAANYLTVDWASLGLPSDPIKGVVALSGVFDVAPLMQTSLNTKLKLDQAQAKALNLITSTPRSTAALVLAVGERESSEFHRQSADLAKSWAILRPQVLELPQANHFTIVDDLSGGKGQLNRLAIELAGG